MEWRRARKSSNLILSYDVPSCTHMYLRILTMYLCFVLSEYARSLGASNPPGNNPLSGPMCGWLCWELIIPWKCYQPHDMYSSYSILNKELTSLNDLSKSLSSSSCSIALDNIDLLPIASRIQISRKTVNCTLPGLQIKPSRLRLVLNN